MNEKMTPTFFKLYTFYLKNWIDLLLANLYKQRKGTLRSETILATKISLKIMRNAFYFTSKALFILKIFKLLSWLFGHVAKHLDDKDKVNFKFYTCKTIEVKANQRMKFVQLIEFKMRNIFCWKIRHNIWQKLVPYPFQKN